MTNKLVTLFHEIEKAQGLVEYVPELARRSAILLPLLCPKADYEQDIVQLEKWRLVFTIRATHLKEHAGEVAFPGGRIDPTETPLETAMREANEEIGIHANDILAHIKLNHSFARSGYHIAPFCALLLDSKNFVQNIGEVSHVINLTIEQLLSIEAWSEERSIMNFTRKVWHYPVDLNGVGEIDIWGATGNILHDFLLRIKKLI